MINVARAAWESLVNIVKELFKKHRDHNFISQTQFMIGYGDSISLYTSALI